MHARHNLLYATQFVLQAQQHSVVVADLWWVVPQGLDEPEEDALLPEERTTLTAIRLQKKKVKIAHRLKKGAANNQSVLPRRADAARTSTTSNMKVRALSASNLHHTSSHLTQSAFCWSGCWSKVYLAAEESGFTFCVRFCEASSSLRIHARVRAW